MYLPVPECEIQRERFNLKIFSVVDARELRLWVQIHNLDGHKIQVDLKKSFHQVWL